MPNDKSQTMNGWVVVDFGRFNHIVPEDELDHHHPQNCACRPSPDDEDETVIIHNSLDGREAFERGERKPS